MNDKEFGVILGAIILLFAIVAFAPVFTIWSVNLLFGLTIPLNGWTWLAALWLVIAVKGSTYNSKS